MINYQKVYRLSLAIAILFFIIFQVLIISVNLKYGQVTEIEANNSRLVISPDQYQFDPYSNTTQTMTTDSFYILGSSSNGNETSKLELISSHFSDDKTQILGSTIIYDLPALDTNLKYSGLFYFDRSLWTIGSLTTIVDNTTLRFESVILQVDLQGSQLRRIPMPIKTYNYSQISEVSLYQRILLSVNDLEIKFLEKTPGSTTITTYSFNLPSFVSDEIIHSPENNQAFIEGTFLWLRFPADPYLLFEPDTPTEQIQESHPQFNAISLENTEDIFVRSSEIKSIRSNTMQVSLAKVTSEDIEQPVFNRDDQFLMIKDNQAILPVFIAEFTSNSTQAFYGFDIYSLGTGFFTLSNSLFLTMTVISTIIAIYSSIKHRSLQWEKLSSHIN